MKPASPPFARPVWELCRVHGVGREALKETLGEPHYVETDSESTHGGEEDWWTFELEPGRFAGVVLRVPYEDAILYSNVQDAEAPMQAFAAVLALGRPERYEFPFFPLS